MTIEVYGEGAIIDQAIRYGVVGQFEAGALRFALGALTRPDEAGHMRLLAPLRVANGRLSLGQIQLPVDAAADHLAAIASVPVHRPCGIEVGRRRLRLGRLR